MHIASKHKKYCNVVARLPKKNTPPSAVALDGIDIYVSSIYTKNVGLAAFKHINISFSFSISKKRNTPQMKIIQQKYLIKVTVLNPSFKKAPGKYSNNQINSII